MNTFEIEFDDEQDLESLYLLLAENVPELEVEKKAAETPDNTLPGETLTQLVIALSGSTMTSTTLVLRRWLKNRNTVVKIKFDPESGRATEVNATNAEKVLPQIEALLKEMIRDSGGEDGA